MSNLKDFFKIIGLIVLFLIIFFFTNEVIRLNISDNVTTTNNLNFDKPIDNQKEIDSYQEDVVYQECLEEKGDEDTCLFGITTSNIKTYKDLDLCESMIYPETKEACKNVGKINLAAEALDIDLCNSVEESFLGNCISKVSLSYANQNKDIDICNKLPEGESKDTCIADLAFKVAYDTGDDSWCQYIKDDYVKEGCISEANFIKQNGNPFAL